MSTSRYNTVAMFTLLMDACYNEAESTISLVSPYKEMLNLNPPEFLHLCQKRLLNAQLY